ncbi:putative protein (DUF262, DUF1524 domains) [Campylobacter ureolyticus RIGS 9880]|uniref:DUF262 domain-containing protein n=1 Tax=Campylobacter ureolyticus RIGS 9880 TaxID=1032069 RepID=A0AAU8TYD1_9BACT|nr:DUF262 domain-containing protein [Campylobacter ureolyticus]AKT90565.1 putative protein (DUF262, DUF1524 domains) [Campylobacter ureolyticus RIGS 9880]
MNKITEYDLSKIINMKLKVPFFQRDYTWDSENLKSLIDDGQKELYIGNIVVQNDLIIDGQQRLMSLYLLNKFIGEECFNICYEVDDSDNDKLKNLKKEKFELMEFQMSGLNNMCRYISRNYTNKEKIEKINNCLKNVYFTITELSDDINPGRYFEAMNTNKQQLKHHEILKAKFVEKLSNGYLDIAKIWDYCSDMNSYFMQDSLYCKDKKIDFIIKNNIKKEAKNIQITINEILKEQVLANDVNIDKKDYEVKSIIKFEEFLCVVARIIGVDMPLQTKELVKNFEDKILSKELSKKFIKALFKYRRLFDKYVFKRDLENKYIQKFGDKKLLMIQLLFEVQNSNEWLVEYLKVCESLGDVNQHIGKLEEIDKERMQALIKDKNLENLLDQGTDTPHYFFYKLDYLLWKKLGEEITNSEFKIWDGIENQKSIYDKFYITKTGSVEHIQPQSKTIGDFEDFYDGDKNNDDKKDNGRKKRKIDNFGNLALLTSSRNSSLGNLEVNEKKAKIDNWIKGEQSIQSLKMLLALEKYPDWNYGESTTHRKEMIELLKDSLN